MFLVLNFLQVFTSIGEFCHKFQAKRMPGQTLYIQLAWHHCSVTTEGESHVNPSVVGPAFESAGQTIKTVEPNISKYCWAHQVACVRPLCCDVLGSESGWCACPGTTLSGWPNDYNIMQHPQMFMKILMFEIRANNTQHVAKRFNRVAKRTQHVTPNNVAICCVEMLGSRKQRYNGSFGIWFS